MVGLSQEHHQSAGPPWSNLQRLVPQHSCNPWLRFSGHFLHHQKCLDWGRPIVSLTSSQGLKSHYLFCQFSLKIWSCKRTSCEFVVSGWMPRRSNKERYIVKSPSKWELQLHVEVCDSVGNVRGESNYYQVTDQAVRHELVPPWESDWSVTAPFFEWYDKCGLRWFSSSLVNALPATAYSGCTWSHHPPTSQALPNIALFGYLLAKAGRGVEQQQGAI